MLFLSQPMCRFARSWSEQEIFHSGGITSGLRRSTARICSPKKHLKRSKTRTAGGAIHALWMTSIEFREFPWLIGLVTHFEPPLKRASLSERYPARAREWRQVTTIDSFVSG